MSMNNDAPEKIYIFDNPILDFTKLSVSESDTDIEYTRTDAFIEKACEWLKENKEHPLIGCEDPCLSGYLTDEFIEDFKKAMEE